MFTKEMRDRFTLFLLVITFIVYPVHAYDYYQYDKLSWQFVLFVAVRLIEGLFICGVWSCFNKLYDYAIGAYHSQRNV